MNLQSYKYSTYGDQTEFISNYFDTEIGPKKESESYRLISQKLNARTQ